MTTSPVLSPSADAEWQVTVDALGEVVWLLDLEHAILRANKATEAVFGVPAAEVIGKKCWEVAHGTAEPIPECPMVRMKASGRRQCTSLQAGQRCTDVSVDPLVDESGRLIGAVHLISDVATRVNLEAELRQAQKLADVGRLAGGVAHDFNNIVAAILLRVGVLQLKGQLDPGVHSTLAEIEAEAKRAANLTQQLLLFSRQTVMKTAAVDLSDLVERLLRMVRRLIGEHIDVAWRPQPGLPLVEADAGTIEQVIVSLCVNARDAMPKGGHLSLAVSAETVTAEEGIRYPDRQPDGQPDRQPGTYVCVTVADTGHGMDPRMPDRIFEPFFTAKEAGQGTGLRLATAFGIAAQHRGWIDARSEPGSGSTFRLWLPAIRSPVATETAGIASPVPGGNETILLVEDERPVREAASAYLRELGYRVLEAGSGVEALAIWQAHGSGIDLLLTDMVMPGGMTGLELVELLQQRSARLKVMISSGYHDEMVRLGLEDRPGLACVLKPCRGRDLAQAVRTCLDRLQD